MTNSSNDNQLDRIEALEKQLSMQRDLAFFKEQVRDRLEASESKWDGEFSKFQKTYNKKMIGGGIATFLLMAFTIYQTATPYIDRLIKEAVTMENIEQLVDMKVEEFVNDGGEKYLQGKIDQLQGQLIALEKLNTELEGKLKSQLEQLEEFQKIDTWKYLAIKGEVSSIQNLNDYCFLYAENIDLERLPKSIPSLKSQKSRDPRYTQRCAYSLYELKEFYRGYLNPLVGKSSLALNNVRISKVSGETLISHITSGRNLNTKVIEAIVGELSKRPKKDIINLMHRHDSFKTNARVLFTFQSIIKLNPKYKESKWYPYWSDTEGWIKLISELK